MKLRGTEKKKKLVCVSKRDILIYATFPFESPGDMRKGKSRREAQHRGSRSKKTVFGGEGGGGGRLMTYS